MGGEIGASERPPGYLTCKEIAAAWGKSNGCAHQILLTAFERGKIKRVKVGREYCYGPFSDPPPPSSPPR